MGSLKTNKYIYSHIKSMILMYLGLPRQVYILFLGKLISSIGAFISPLLTLILTQKLGLGVSTSSKFIAFNLLCQVVCTLIGGKLVDTIGRKKVMIVFPSLKMVPINRTLKKKCLVYRYFLCIILISILEGKT